MKKSLWKRFVSTVAAAAMAVMSVPIGAWARPESDDVTDVKKLNPTLEYKSEEFSEEIEDGVVENGKQVAARVEATFEASNSPLPEIWYCMDFPASSNFVPITEGSKEYPLELYNTANDLVGWYYIKDGHYYFYVDETFAEEHTFGYEVWFKYHGQFQFDKDNVGKENVWYGEDPDRIHNEVYPDFQPVVSASKKGVLLSEEEKDALEFTDEYIIKYEVTVTGCESDYFYLKYVTDEYSSFLKAPNGGTLPTVTAVYKNSAWNAAEPERTLTATVEQGKEENTYKFILDPKQKLGSSSESVTFTYYMALDETYTVGNAIKNTAVAYAETRYEEDQPEIRSSEAQGWLNLSDTSVAKSGSINDDGDIVWTVTVTPGLDFKKEVLEDWYFTDELGDYLSFTDDIGKKFEENGLLEWGDVTFQKDAVGNYVFSYVTSIGSDFDGGSGNYTFTNEITLHKKDVPLPPVIGTCSLEGEGVGIDKAAVPYSYDANTQTVDWEISFTIPEGIKSYKWVEERKYGVYSPVDRYLPDYAGEKLPLSGITGVYDDAGTEKSLEFGTDYEVTADTYSGITVELKEEGITKVTGKKVTFTFPTGVPENFDPNTDSIENTVKAFFTDAMGSPGDAEAKARYYFPPAINKGNLEKSNVNIVWADLIQKTNPWTGPYMDKGENWGKAYTHSIDEMVWTLQIDKSKLMTDGKFNRGTVVDIEDTLPDDLEYVKDSAVVGFLFQGNGSNYLFLYPEMNIEDTSSGNNLHLKYTLEEGWNRLSDFETNNASSGEFHTPGIWGAKIDDLTSIVILYRTKVQNALDPLKPNSTAPLSKEFQNIAEYTITYDGKTMAEG